MVYPITGKTVKLLPLVQAAGGAILWQIWRQMNILDSLRLCRGVCNANPPQLQLLQASFIGYLYIIHQIQPHILAYINDHSQLLTLHLPRPFSFGLLETLGPSRAIAPLPHSVETAAGVDTRRKKIL